MAIKAILFLLSIVPVVLIVFGGVRMSKWIRLADATYYRLSQERKGGESFDEALKRLLRWDEK